MGFRQSVTFKRPSSVTYVNGVAQAVTFAVSIIQASIQPLTPDEMKLLPEGRRNTAAYNIITSTSLRPAKEAAGRQADIIVIGGEDYEVISCEYWINNVINHCKAVIVRIES